MQFPKLSPNTPRSIGLNINLLSRYFAVNKRLQTALYKYCAVYLLFNTTNVLWRAKEFIGFILFAVLKGNERHK